MHLSLRLFNVYGPGQKSSSPYSGVIPIFTSQSMLIAQSNKKNPAQASKYAKRGSAKAKKKDFMGALSDYKKAYQLNPSANYKKKVQELIILRLQKIISKNYQRHLTAPCQRPLQLQLLGILSVGGARI